MYCSNCGNKIENGDKFCRFCSKEIIYNQVENTTTSSNNNEVGSNILVEKCENMIFNHFDNLEKEYSNLFNMLLRFEGAVGLHFILMIIGMFIGNSEDGVSQGLVIIFGPILAIVFVIPQTIGFIIEKIYNHKPKKSLVCLMFIASCLTLVSILLFINECGCSNGIAVLLIIHSILLIIHYFLKLKK